MRDPRLDLARKYYDAQLDQEAWRLVAEIVAEPAPPFEALQFAASLSFEARDLAAAISYCDRALSAVPGAPHVLLLKGRALFDQGDVVAADTILSQAVAADPDNAAVHFNRGLILEALGRLTEAERSYRDAIRRQSPYPVAWNNLGNVLDALGHPDDAVAAFAVALEQLPGYAAAINNIGATESGQGRFAAAAAAYVKALAIDPGNRAAMVNLGVAEVERGRAEAGHRRLMEVRAAVPDDPQALTNSLFSLHNFTIYPAELAAGHVAAASSTDAPSRPPLRAPDPERRLRIGYVSADFRRHSVAYFIEQLLRHHDAASVDVYAYANVAVPDATTRRIQALVPHWRPVVGLNTQRLVDLIRTDAIDVLVDLSGHTQGHRLDIFKCRPAPVQITGIGYPGSTGLTVFDGRLCDAITDPSVDDQYSSEPPLRLATGLHCYHPPSAAPLVAPRGDGPIVFGSFNKLAKLSDLTVTLWAQVLRACPEGRLRLKTKPLVEAETCDDVARRFVAAGIERHRLSLSGWNPDDRDHLAAYNEVDIALDTFPYCGTTTTCEALWMGVPVVTLKGQTHAARVGASLLTSVGLMDWIADDSARFVAIATAAARDRRALAALRTSLRDRVAASRLCDGRGYAAAVEAEYRSLWRNACAIAKAE